MANIKLFAVLFFIGKHHIIPLLLLIVVLVGL